MKRNKALYIVISIIIIVGIIIGTLKGFVFEKQYSERYQIRIDNNTEMELSKVKEITKEILGDKNFTINKVEIFGNSFAISSENITEEEKISIINKINETYSTSINVDNIKINKISHTRIRDIIKPYIVPGIITLIVIIAYSVVRYGKNLGILKVLLKSTFIPVVLELVFYSIVAIARIPFGDITTAIAIGIYVSSIIALTFNFERNFDEIKVNEENSK